MKTIRADIEHLDQLAGLFNQYRMFYQQASDPGGCRTFMKERMVNGQSVIFAAQENDGSLAGFTQLYCSFCSVELKPLVYLYDLFVNPGVRRSGVARGLMEAAKQFATEHGADRLKLETATDNAQAQALYEDLGYKREKEFFTYHLAL